MILLTCVRYGAHFLRSDLVCAFVAKCDQRVCQFTFKLNKRRGRGGSAFLFAFSKHFIIFKLASYAFLSHGLNSNFGYIHFVKMI